MKKRRNDHNSASATTTIAAAAAAAAATTTTTSSDYDRYRRRRHDDDHDDDDQMQAEACALGLAAAVAAAAGPGAQGMSAAALLAREPPLYRMFVEEYLPRHSAVEAIASATTPDAALAALQHAEQLLQGRALAKAVARGLVEAVVRAMRDHHAAHTVVAAAANMLHRVANDIALRNTLTEAGAVEQLLTAMREHKANAIAVSYCASTLWSASVEPQCQHRIGEAGGIALMAELLQLHSHDASVVEVACGVLRNASIDPENKRRTIALAIPGIIYALNTFVDCAPIVTEAIATLCNIAVLPADHSALLSNRCFEAIVATLKVTQEPTALSWGLGVLCNLFAVDLQRASLFTPEIHALVQHAFDSVPPCRLMQCVYDSIMRNEDPASCKARELG
jgi:hypothetical protein